MKLINEYIEHQDLEILTEAKVDGKGKNFFIKGPFLQAEVKNKNGRIYAKPLLEREIASFRSDKINSKRAFGELDHPPSPTVNLQNVSHIIESLEMDGNNGIGKAKILPTPQGRIVETLLAEGTQLGVSTRGVGSLNGDKVGDDFKLITVDIVADPSAHSAYVEGILEGKDYIINNDSIIEKVFKKFEKGVNENKDLHKHLMNFLDELAGRMNNNEI